MNTLDTNVKIKLFNFGKSDKNAENMVLPCILFPIKIG